MNALTDCSALQASPSWCAQCSAHAVAARKAVRVFSGPPERAKTLKIPVTRRPGTVCEGCADQLYCPAGIAYLACPVFGRPDAVAARKAVMVLSGPPEAKEKVRPLLEPLGRAILGE